MSHPRDDRANRTQVLLTLSDGSVVVVGVRLSLSNKLADTLNNADTFLDAILPDGQQLFIAKSSIRSVRSAAVPRADQLEEGVRPGPGGFDPHAVLKVEKGASPEQIRAAYHRMARLYHPDRLASYELPDEVKSYVRDMLVRINLAFEQIGQAR